MRKNQLVGSFGQTDMDKVIMDINTPTRSAEAQFLEQEETSQPKKRELKFKKWYF